MKRKKKVITGSDKKEQTWVVRRARKGGVKEGRSVNPGGDSPPKIQKNRPRGCPWPKGVSGNPAGRPRGARNKFTLAVIEGVQRAEELTGLWCSSESNLTPTPTKLCLIRTRPRSLPSALTLVSATLRRPGRARRSSCKMAGLFVPAPGDGLESNPNSIFNSSPPLVLTTFSTFTLL